MDLIHLIVQYGAWSWIVGGLVLLALELIVPGGVLVWFGISAIVTGILSLRYAVDVSVQFGFFGVLVLVTVWVWLKLVRQPARRAEAESEAGRYLNDRAERFVGIEAVLKEPITSGFGRLPLGDSVWRVSGPDLPAGRKVRIVGHEGPVLKVEAA
jgi:membrane protein implicated in regulation of membrane protease activity